MTDTEHLPAVHAWIEAHAADLLADVAGFCRQPSVSATGEGLEEMASLVATHLAGSGCEVALVPTAGPPVAVGRLDGRAPRRLAFYNHYDVQPPDPLAAWRSPPFEPTVRDGALYARGTADNKGNLVARMWAVRAWREVTGGLPCAVTFVAEGEEEVGSPNLEAFAADHRDLLDADGYVWEAGYREPDGALNFYAGVKGLAYVELRVRAVAYDLHSSWAPLAPSASWRLVHALATLADRDGRVRPDGVAAAVRPPDDAARDIMRRFPLDLGDLRERWEVERLVGESTGPAEAAEATERLLYSPTCNLAGLWSGYQGPGTKTVLPAEAGAKLDLRLVPDQDPGEVVAALRRHLDAHGFDDVDVTVLPGSERPGQSAVDGPLMRALVASAQAVYDVAPRMMPRAAGTGPMEVLCQRHGIPAAGGAGIGHAGSRIHAPDENVRIADVLLGCKHIAALLPAFAAA